MTIAVDFNITKVGNDTIIVKDSDSGWGGTPSAKVVLTIRDKVFISDVLAERTVEVVLYDADATAEDDIGTSVADQQAGVLFALYTGVVGLTLTADQIYGATVFLDSMYQISIESPGDVTALTKSFYSISQIETIGIAQTMCLDRPYNSPVVALKATMPWHLADGCSLAAKQNDSILFYNLLQFINRNYK